MRPVLALVVGLLAAGSADARKINLPSVELHCRSDATWYGIDTCMSREGTFLVLRMLPRAKLVQLIDKVSGAQRLYVYEQHRTTGEWNRSPFRLTRDSWLRITEFARLRTLDGFHVDFETRRSESFVANDGSADDATVFRTTTIACFSSDDCDTRVVSCDAYLAGRAVSTFHGSLVEDSAQKTIDVTGDPIAAAGPCARE